MRNRCFWLVLFVFLFSVEGFAQVVDIPDENLRAVIETALGKRAGARITEAEMETLERIGARGAGIVDLTGLEFATNLRSLGLGDNAIEDISPLEDLTSLRSLGIFNNAIEDISPLAGLTDLRELGIADNAIEDISPLEGLINLISLGAFGNLIEDISPLKGLVNLSRVRLHYNNISDITPLVENSGLGAGDTLDIRYNVLDDESIDTGVPALKARGVDVAYDMPIDIPDPNLRAAIESVLGKDIDEVITTSDMETLSDLHVVDRDISDLTGLAFATDLTDLGLWDNNIADISELADLTQLTHLALGGNPITDISPVAGLKNLRLLHLPSSHIADDISFVAELVNLTYLNLNGTNISDISELAGLTQLTELYLGWNNITDISALAELPNLRVLWLQDNNITDISPLTELTELVDLYLGDNNPIADLSLMCEIIENNPNLLEVTPIVPGCELPDDGIILDFHASDLDGNGRVNIWDIIIVIEELAIQEGDFPQADVNGDGVVTVNDLISVIVALDDWVYATAPPIATEAIAMDHEMFEMALNRLRLASDGSLRYREAIAVIENLRRMVAPPDKTALLANYPNPFNPETWIPYHLANDTDVEISIYDINGALVRQLDLGYQQAGYYTNRSRAAYWDGRNEFGERVATGIYFYQLRADNMSLLRKMVILK